MQENDVFIGGVMDYNNMDIWFVSRVCIGSSSRRRGKCYSILSSCMIILDVFLGILFSNTWSDRVLFVAIGDNGSTGVNSPTVAVDIILHKGVWKAAILPLTLLLSNCYRD